MTTQYSALSFNSGPSKMDVQYCDKDPESLVSSWHGRPVSSEKSLLKTVCERSTCAAQHVLSKAGLIASDPNILAGVFRRLNGQVFDAMGHFKKNQGYYTKFRAAIASFVGFVDTLQLAGDALYFYTKKYKEDTKLKVASQAALCMANLGGAMLWMQELGFVKLSKTARVLGEIHLFSWIPKMIASIPVVRDIHKLERAAIWMGKVRVFSPLSKLSMEVFAGNALAMFYLLSALDNVHTIAKGGLTSSGKIQAGLELSYYASELTLTAAIAFGAANPVGLGVLGATCIATGLASFVHKSSVKAT